MVNTTVCVIVALTGRGDRRYDDRPTPWVPKAKTHGNRAAGCEFDGTSEANNTTSVFGVFGDVRKIDWR